MTSNKRGQRNTASGYQSYHYLGRAVDFVSPNMDLAWQLLAASGIPWTELYFTPQGFMRRGKMVHQSLVSPITRKNHWDHVHVALRDGGIIPTGRDVLSDYAGSLIGGDRESVLGNFAQGILGAREDAGFGGEPSLGVYDSGGILQPGDLAINLGNTPERITTDAQWRTIQDAAHGNSSELRLSQEDLDYMVEAMLSNPTVLRVDSQQIAYANRRGESNIGPRGGWSGAPRLGRK